MSKSNGQIEEKKQNLNESERLEAIKNLIFGENIQQIDNDFEFLKNKIEQRKQELENLIEETNKELSSLVDSMATDINIRITDVEEKFSEKIEDLEQRKVNKSNLGTLFIELGEKLKAK